MLTNNLNIGESKPNSTNQELKSLNKINSSVNKTLEFKYNTSQLVVYRLNAILSYFSCYFSFLCLKFYSSLKKNSSFLVYPNKNKKLSSTIIYMCLINILLMRQVHACEIWKAADCISSITAADEELMKEDDYTKEQLYKYCDKGKAYVDCINSKLKCCDLKPELRGALAAYDKQLEKQAWKLGPYCSGLGESNVVKYKCRTTTKATTSTATKSTKSTLAPCQVEKVTYFFFLLY